jgi:acetolactate synthase-1/2/3 large subunit
MEQQSVADLIIKCLEEEGVKYVFGLPGEENIKLVNAIHRSSKIKFILVRHEQGASFMASTYGRITQKAAVCTSTLGPGAINLLLGVTDAYTESTPLVAISAQVGLNRIYKETHQAVDLVQMFKPVTKWAELLITPASTPELIRQAFDAAQTERPGSTYIAVPQDVEGALVDSDIKPLSVHTKHDSIPSQEAIDQAVDLIQTAKRPVLLIGHGAVRAGAKEEVRALANYLNIPVSTTFMAKGIVSDRDKNALGVVGFMNHDYENFAFDQADLILSIGYELQEFLPSRINPNKDKKIVHINSFILDIDANFSIDASIEGNVRVSVKKLLEALKNKAITFDEQLPEIKALVEKELSDGEKNNDFPVKPQRLVSSIRKLLKDDDIVLSDTGAIKMWMSRLYPTYEPNTCIISNGLSTMSFSLPGAIGAHFAVNGKKKVLATMGDGSFMMNSQEIETAIRENVPLKVLIWEDKAYGLIKWKMDMEIKTHDDVDFNNPDFVKYAESFGAKGYRISKAEDLDKILETAMNEDGVSIIVCPVDYSENMKLTDKLGELTMPN